MKQVFHHPGLDDLVDPHALEGAKQSGITGPGFYYWDETQAFAIGPFVLRSEAEESLLDYAHYLEERTTR